jgi:hypothetical protein
MTHEKSFIYTSRGLAWKRFSMQIESHSLYSSLQFASISLYPSPREWRPDLSLFVFVCLREKKRKERAAALVLQKKNPKRIQKMVKINTSKACYIHSPL